MVAVSVPRAASARTQRSIAAVICTRQSSIGRPDGRCCVSVMAAARSSSVAMIAPTRSCRASSGSASASIAASSDSPSRRRALFRWSTSRVMARSRVDRLLMRNGWPP